jgi:trehalose 6-phosphate phosphatase
LTRGPTPHLEDKHYAVAVHTWRVPDPGRWAAPIDEAAGRRPTGTGWRSGVRGVMVAGDDLGDLPAFAAAAQLMADGIDGLRIAVRSAEAPPPLLAEADLIVDGPEGLREVLQQLTARPPH